MIFIVDIGISNLETARLLLLKELNVLIETDIINDFKFELHVIFKNGVNVYIRYNNFGKYAYQIQISPKKLDRLRFDNYDNNWSVKTRPNHYHIRGKKEGIESPMKGNPKDDIPILIKYIKGNYNIS